MRLIKVEMREVEQERKTHLSCGSGVHFHHHSCVRFELVSLSSNHHECETELVGTSKRLFCS